MNEPHTNRSTEREEGRYIEWGGEVSGEDERGG